MKAQTQRSCPKLSIISITSVLFYCVGFLRVEMELSNHRKKIADLEDFLDAMKVHEGLTQGTLAGKYFKGTLECVHLEKQNLNFPSLSLAICQSLPFFAILIPVWLLITVLESVNPVGQILSRFFVYFEAHLYNVKMTRIS